MGTKADDQRAVWDRNAAAMATAAGECPNAPDNCLPGCAPQAQAPQARSPLSTPDVRSGQSRMDTG